MPWVRLKGVHVGSGPEHRSDVEELLPIIRAKKANRLLLQARPNVIGLDVGFRVRQGEVTQERVVKVYVSQKIDASFLSEEQRIPSTVSFDGREIGVDVEQRAIPEPTSFTLRDRPLRGGMSISTIDDDLGGTGTLGICVTLNDANAYILSNNHVLAGANTAPIEISIIQPGEGDGGVIANDIVAKLSTFVPIDFGTSTIEIPGERPIEIPNPNLVDAALAKIQNPDPILVGQADDGYNIGNRELHWIGYPRQLVSGEWSEEQKLFLLGLRVCKMGRTTAFTMGTIISVSADGLVGPYVNDKFAWFMDQILIAGDDGRPFAKRGDSGALVVALETGQPQNLPFPPVIRGTDPIALHFAAAKGTSLALANPLDAVLDALGIPQL
jgi:hypothetical protein